MSEQVLRGGNVMEEKSDKDTDTDCYAGSCGRSTDEL